MASLYFIKLKESYQDTVIQSFCMLLKVVYFFTVYFFTLYFPPKSFTAVLSFGTYRWCSSLELDASRRFPSISFTFGHSSRPSSGIWWKNWVNRCLKRSLGCMVGLLQKQNISTGFWRPEISQIAISDEKKLKLKKGGRQLVNSLLVCVLVFFRGCHCLAGIYVTKNTHKPLCNKLTIMDVHLLRRP